MKRRHGVYYFRARIPFNFTSILGRHEYRKSLRTKDKRIATQSATLLKDQLDKTLRKLRKMQRTLTTENFDKVALELFELEMDFFYEQKHDRQYYKNEEFLKFSKTMFDGMLELSATEGLTVPLSILNAENILNEMGINLPEDKRLYHRFETTLQSIMAFWHNCFTEKMQGHVVPLEEKINSEHKKYQERINSIAPQINHAFPKDPPSDINQKPVSDVATEYLNHLVVQKGKNAPAATTIEDYQAKLNIYITMLGDKEFSSVSKQDIVDCKNLTYNLPKNINKINWSLSHISIQELINDKNHNYERIEITTVSKYLSQLKKLCAFAYENNYCSTNPAHEINFEFTKTVQNEREAFSQDELKLIFNGYLYRPEPAPARLKLKPYQFWIPLLGAFTGARLNEICSLYIEDIQLDPDTGRYFFDINSNRDDKNLKTNSSQRKIPISNVVLNIGFMDYLEYLKEHDKTRIFPELRYCTKKGYGKDASRWFNKFDKNGKSYSKGYLALVGVKTINSPKQSKNFHCFRHTFIHNLKNNPSIDISRIADLVGHEKGELQTQSYGGSEYTMKVKIHTIDQLDYGICLDHINWSHFLEKLNS